MNTGSIRGFTVWSIGSHDGAIWRTIYQGDVSLDLVSGWPPFQQAGDRDAFERIFEHESIESRWQWCGYDFGALRKICTDSDTFRFAAISYWSLILPLTLVSAYLILWKPQKKPVGTIHAEIA